MNTPIKTAVDGFLAEGRAPFHMPGHKGRGQAEFFPSWQLDITEVQGVDSLYHADGAILECEKEYAELYGSAASFISAGGSTLCIQTMLGLVAHRGRKIIAGRMIHSSAVAAMALLGLEPQWIYTRAANAQQGIQDISLPVTAWEVASAIEKNPDAAAVYITSPDYFGQMADVKAIAEVCHAKGIPLLVDNAHGAHLKFFGRHPMQQGADMCSDSLHKTMPVLTGGAMLHVSTSEWAERAKETMALFGSTSPSYLIMLSVDTALKEIKGRYGEKALETALQMKELRELAIEHGFEVTAPSSEPMRLTVGFARAGWNDGEFGQYIRKAGIEPEYIGGGAAVFMASPYTLPEDIKRLKAAVQGFEPKKRSAAVSTFTEQVILPRMCDLRSAVLAPHINLPVGQCIGHTCGGVVSTCPPGIPLLVPGELITPKMAQLLESRGVVSITVVK